MILARPLSDFPVPETPERRNARFVQHGKQRWDGSWQAARPTPYTQTEQELDRELHRIGVTDAVLELDVRPEDFRLDGRIRAGASPRTPRVVLSFEHPAQGPIRMPCDTFSHWVDNVRAIRLALEALRAVDRYGVTRKAEQYRGWTALPAESSAGLNVSAAARVLVAYDPATAALDSKGAALAAERLLASVGVARKALRAAALATHPDAGGATERFQDVQAARTTLAVHFGVSTL